MDKIAKGRARSASLKLILEDLLSQEDSVLSKILEKGKGLIKKDGTFHLGELSKMVGYECKAVSFRQNKSLTKQVQLAHEELVGRGVITTNEAKDAGQTKQEIGDENERLFLLWIRDVGSPNLPAPLNHNGRLYRKAIWAMYSNQPLIEVNRPPTWFNSRPEIKASLEALDVNVVRGEVQTIQMDAESVADDMENTMTSALVRKLRSEVKELKAKLASEREARVDAELKSKQNKLLATQVHTGKMAPIND